MLRTSGSQCKIEKKWIRKCRNNCQQGKKLFGEGGRKVVNIVNKKKELICEGWKPLKASEEIIFEKKSESHLSKGSNYFGCDNTSIRKENE